MVIEEQKWKKVKEKEEKERYELKMEREAQEYNPYGRSGGGAPMRDNQGKIVADLRSMRQDNSIPSNSPRKYQPYVSPRAPPGGPDVRDDLFGPPPVQTTTAGEETFARGGHGIFGMPKTEKEKNDAERYKDDLRRQIEQRKMEEIRRKDAERQEEEREQKKLEEQQKRMQAEFEAEQQKIKEKEEEARRKNEELIRQAEERKRDAEERRKAADEARAAEERKEKEAEFNARLATETRGKSPVIPALRSKEATDGEARRHSPPVPAARTHTIPPDEQPSTSEQSNPPPRAGSADVLNQLAAMRSQLQNERKRVETMLQNEKNEPDVFDPRLVQRPAPAPVVKPEVDIFETARTGNAVQVRRTPADRGNPQAMDEFSHLKTGQSESRKEFQRMFPDQPASGDTLEAQQAALLKLQEEKLQNLRERRPLRQGEFDSGYPKSNTPARSLQTRTPQQLHSDSAFVDLGSVNNFPDDFDDIPPTSQYRNESARSRRRNRGDYSPRRRNWRDSSPLIPNRRDSTPRDNDPFGSTTSLNVDRLAKKNQDRLKRLRELQGDEMSLYDPDDVLDRFMSKQAHNRPPSGQTLQDDTWMYAGSKASGY